MLKHYFRQLFQFIKKPNGFSFSTLTTREKILNILLYYSTIALLVGISLSSILIFLVSINFISPLNYKYDFRYWEFILVGVLLAPFLEEVIFRGFLGTVKTSPNFKWFYYLSALIFGLVHIFNFENWRLILPFFWIVTSAQIFLGLVCGYIRVTYGLRYAILLHALYNLVLINLSQLTNYISKITE